MDVYYSYNYLTSLWLTLQSLPLLLSPTLLTTLLSPTVRESTHLESYLSRSLGLSQLLIATLTLLLTGCVPLTTSLATSTDTTDPTAPYALPTLCLTLAYHGAAAFYCWTQYAGGGGGVYCLAAVVSGGLAAVGGWCVLFASSEGRISRKTGADKRTSGFPFQNKEADRKKRVKL